MGKHFFGLSETSSLILSLVVGISSIIVETILFIIKMEKLEAADRERASKKV